MLQEVSDDLLRLCGDTVILQRGQEGTLFLGRLEARFAAGAEGNFRRAWLLTAALEDYFVLRHIWYQGPKKALAWMARADLAGHAMFVEALKPGAGMESIDRLVRHVVGEV